MEKRDLIEQHFHSIGMTVSEGFRNSEAYTDLLEVWEKFEIVKALGEDSPTANEDAKELLLELDEIEERKNKLREEVELMKS